MSKNEYRLKKEKKERKKERKNTDSHRIKAV